MVTLTKLQSSSVEMVVLLEGCPISAAFKNQAFMVVARQNPLLRKKAR
jgi:hypothetical protein